MVEGGDSWDGGGGECKVVKKGKGHKKSRGNRREQERGAIINLLNCQLIYSLFWQKGLINPLDQH